MLIHLVRHGIAADVAVGGRDEDRELTEEGVAKLRRAGKAWRELVEPTEIWSSPLRRAQQTAAILAKAVRFDGEVRTVDGLRPEDPVLEVVQQLEQALQAGTVSVVLVGHEPHLGCLLGYLLHGREHAAIPLRKGMLATVETLSATSVQGRLRVVLGQRTAARLA
ncbi:MAG: phosphohistidine phosphatase SixA [Planctomycetes bacterium]|nr:phosphohistidine phosphatase SixA [Planctomycetota bacterium]MCB9884337.1 phosphohistidine phosphatase SixA [Planctomycetota bacterium]